MAPSALVFAVGVFCLVGVMGVSGERGEGALKLTPMLAAGEAAAARAAARVNAPTLYDGVSYSGYLTVEQTQGVNLFFWFFPSKDLIEAEGENFDGAQSNNSLTIWMNGGPGVSSMQGLFWENGPLVAIEGGKVEPRKEGSWLGVTSMLYLDFPANVGFSYTDSRAQRSSKKEYTDDLAEFVRQFYQLFPGLKDNLLYLVGQSYAGKYVLALGARLHETDAAPLAGVVLQGGLTDPEVQFPLYVDYVYNIGAISSAQAWDVRNKAPKMLADVLEGRTPSEDGSYMAVTFLYEYNFGFSRDNFVNDIGFADPFVEGALNATGVREALHARTDVEFRNFNYNVYKNFSDDFPKNAREEMSIMLTNYKVLTYTGSLDATVTPAMADAAVKAAKWPQKEVFRKASRAPWVVNGAVLGWATQTSNLCHVVLHKAGHQTPKDAPAATATMLSDFIHLGCVQNKD